MYNPGGYFEDLLVTHELSSRLYIVNGQFSEYT